MVTGETESPPGPTNVTSVQTKDMTTTLQQQAQETIEANVLKWSLMMCDALTHNGPSDRYFYTLESGRKYHKIFMHIGDRRDSIHAFIDKKTGEVYKPASIKAPAKGVRYDLRLIEQREWLMEHADWAGSYLYAR